MRLYHFSLSSASYRVRIALNLKGIDAEMTSLRLRDGEQRDLAYAAVNPQCLVPTLVLDDGTALTQSQAIIEYLDEAYPEPPLLPRDARGRAWVRAVAQAVACDIHPLNNLRVLRYLESNFGVTQEGRDAWYRYWVRDGLTAIEKMVSPRGPYCLGDEVTLADVCVIPQIFNAHRFKATLDDCPRLLAIEQACLKLPAFDRARPENQPDAT